MYLSLLLRGSLDALKASFEIIEEFLLKRNQELQGDIGFLISSLKPLEDLSRLCASKPALIANNQ